ncbi:MAG: hypothetical protein M1814_000010 [Vezdaea aestivalis]|nr:MAG: hypothetical protein M1814_000010 [Vezdaea aestivalis]
MASQTGMILDVPDPLSLPHARQASSEPPNPRRDSTEDADSLQRRKRPRLDSEGAARRSKSVDRFVSTEAPRPASNASNASSATIPSDDVAPKLTPPEQRTVSRAASMVTINVRQPNPAASLHDDSSATASSTPPADPAMSSPPRLIDAPAEASSSSPAPPIALIPSSPSQSPEIEIAEVEEMDQNDGGGNWRSLVTADVGHDLEDIIAEFPHGDANKESGYGAYIYARHLDKNEDFKFELLVDLRNWMSEFLRYIQQNPTAWWRLVNDEHGLLCEMCGMMESLANRRFALLPCPDFFQEKQVLQDLISTWTSLVKHYITGDIILLRGAANEGTDPARAVSFRALSAARCLLQSDSQLCHLMSEDYDIQLDSILHKILERFLLNDTDNLQLMLACCDLCFEHVPNCAPLFLNVQYSVELTAKAISLANSLWNESDGGKDGDETERFLSVRTCAIEMFEKVDSQLRHIVDRQLSVLSRKYCDGLVRAMHNLALGLAHHNNTLIRRLVASFMSQIELDFSSEATRPHMSRAIAHTWRYLLYQKFIVNGRMEVRSVGVSCMAEFLVETYTSLRNLSDHPILQHLASLIVDNKLVEYLVSPGSHPELIAMSADIVGFLVVTHRYSKHEADAIYDRINNSRDVRTVTAIFEMLRTITNLMSYETLLYICTKLKDVPIERFDDNLRNHFKDVLAKLREKKFAHAPQIQSLDGPVFDVCLRLIRETSRDSVVDKPENISLHQYAVAEFKDLLRHGPDEQVRQAIYDDCIHSIRERTPLATGSVCALGALVSQDAVSLREIYALNEKLPFADLVIEEFIDVVHGCDEGRSGNEGPTLKIISRLDLISYILTQAPDSIDIEHGQKLWSAMVGQNTLKSVEREAAWKTLSHILQRAQTHPNSFIDKVIKVYLPDLEPQYFTLGTLEFAQNVVEYLGRVESPKVPAEYQVVDIAGADQVWNIFLDSPLNGLEANATSYLVKLYLDIRSIKVAPKSSVDATHVNIVTRCVDNLTTSARKLKEKGTLDALEAAYRLANYQPGPIDQEALKFSRSLIFLREFLKGLKARPQYSPLQQRQPRLLPMPDHAKGDEITIKFQVISPKQTAPIRSFNIGEGASLKELRQNLVQHSGLKRFQAIIGGRFYDLEENLAKSLKELNLTSTPWIILRQKQEDVDRPEDSALDSVMVVEAELLKHFAELYALLKLPGDLGNGIWQLLCTFPPQQQIVKVILDPSTSYSDAFPVNYPYKLLYSVNTLTRTLEEQVHTGFVDQRTISRAVPPLVRALTNTQIFDSFLSFPMKLFICNSMLTCLLRYLKEPVSAEVAKTYFPDRQDFVVQLFDMIEAAQTTEALSHLDAANIACQSFAVLLEASLRNENLWKVLKTNSKTDRLIEALLLNDPRPQVRGKTADSIRHVCCDLPLYAFRPQITQSTALANDDRVTEVSASSFANFFWTVISNVIKVSTPSHSQSQEFFVAALEVLRAATRASNNDLPFNQYVSSWGNQLIQQDSHQFVGRENTNFVISGLIQLMTWCLQSSKAMGLAIDTGNLAERILTAHLFPNLSEINSDDWKHERLPMLHSETRKSLQDLVLLLIPDLSTYSDVVHLMAELVPEGMRRVVQDFDPANESEDHNYSLSFGFDRTKAVRSHTGYVGLRNLSNTCYLNSLFSQLFMNVGFREFMLNANAPDGDGSQKLLLETQNLFAHMQDCYEKCVEPRGVTDAIKTYDNESIDVGIQMDVDEFYNLLFDRWESQMLSPEAKKRFRSFYGGQLVQQVKSKECYHISEREEPFSAIQCDIKGKVTLEASLKAYVEGESLEGHNKYSCTSCERHVDAVKRTCLKDIPDNLIFHLKRFEFDLRTMQRSKINEAFDFPDKIDMRPYTLDYLSNPEADVVPDMFAVVGVLIHTGTAESGHYYSYIKERPHPPNTNNWVEYNDSDVGYFNPAFIPTYASGGSEEWRQNNVGPKVFFPKNYSAYMLFYERMKSPQQNGAPELNPESFVPAKASVPLGMKRHIALQNELFVRKHCLYDPYHYQFVKSMLEHLRELNKDCCSDSHVLEEKVLYLAMDHVDQVFSRMRDSGNFDMIISAVYTAMMRCTTCCSAVLEWFVVRHDSLRNLLLRCQNLKVKQDIGKLIFSGLRILKVHAPAVYALENAENDSDSDQSRSSFVFSDTVPTVSIVKKLATLFQPLVDIHLRSFDDYFQLLLLIAGLGRLECGALLHHDFLGVTLNMLICELGGRWVRQFEKFQKHLSKGRKPSMTKAIELVAKLLEQLDLSYTTASDSAERSEYLTDPWPLTADEETMLYLRTRSTKSITFLTKLLDSRANIAAVCRIVTTLCQAEPSPKQLEHIQTTLVNGIHIDPASMAGPYLIAGIAFLQSAPSEEHVRELVLSTARDLETINHQGGREHLQFFKNVAGIRNERIKVSEFYFRELLITNSHLWVPVLLLYWDSDVRDETQTFITRLLFEHGNPPQSGDEARDMLIVDAARTMTKAILDGLVARYIQKRVTFTHRSIDAAIHVTDECDELFDKTEPLDAELLNRKHAIDSALRESAVDDDLEDNNSEWGENDSGIASDSSEIDQLAMAQNASP